MTKENDKIRGFEIAKGWEECSPNLPKRQTKNSAGYDFECVQEIVIPSFWKTLAVNIMDYLRLDFSLKHVKPTLVHTGIKAYMQDDEVLILANRSSNPIKRALVLGNGIGCIDSDYYSNPSNDGEIMFQFYNFSPIDITIKKGERIGQGIFQKFLKMDNDDAINDRLGGLGSTNK